MADEIIFRREGAIGHITLNRPAVLNALDLAMCASVHRQLEEWAGVAEVKSVIVDAVPGRAFCAGGDIRAVWEWATANDPRSLALFAAEYRMNAAIKRFAKPYIALIDGIVMGGGAGISVHGTHRLATENTLFAMPETAIGFFPDVGASYFLSRLPGALGPYLGLTGARIKAADTIYTGLATHFVPAARIGEIVSRLVQGEPIDAVLTDISAHPGDAPLAKTRAAIDRAFSGPSVEAILEGLKREGAWGAETAALLATRSPTSLKLVHRLLDEGKMRDLEACLDMEFAIAGRIIGTNDFREGVRAALIDRSHRPRWQPASLAGVSDDAIAAFFRPEIGCLPDPPAPKWNSEAGLR